MTTQNTANDTAARATRLYRATKALKTVTEDLAGAPTDADRAVLAHSESLCNATLGLLKITFTAAGYKPPVESFFGPSSAQPLDTPATEDSLLAAERVLRLASQAYTRAAAKFNQYAVGDLGQEPTVDDAFAVRAAGYEQQLQSVRQREDILVARLKDVASRNSDKVAGATVVAEAARHLLKGANEDLLIARQQPFVTAAHLQSEKDELAELGDGLAAEFVKGLFEGGAEVVQELVDLGYDSKSAGTRTGFLLATEDETELGAVALDVLVEELNLVEPVPQPVPCWGLTPPPMATETAPETA